jgi:hypothetical protein
VSAEAALLAADTEARRTHRYARLDAISAAVHRTLDQGAGCRITCVCVCVCVCGCVGVWVCV